MKTLLRFTVCVTLLFTTILFSFAQQSQVVSKIAGSGKIHFADLARKEMQNPTAFIKSGPQQQWVIEEQLKGVYKNLAIPANAKITEVKGQFVTDVSKILPDIKSPAPVKSFTGLTDNNTVIPPDVMGAAGPNHLMETLNSQYQILDKNGGLISTLSLSAFWSGLSAIGSPYSDPHLVYDAATGRWITCIVGVLNSGHYALFIAGSLTADPTGAWYEYAIDTGPSSTLPDYPLLGYNNKWVVITTNDFLNLFFNRVRITVLNKANILAGTLGTVNTFFDASGIFTLSPAETLDAGVGTEYMLVNYNGNSGGSGFVQLCTVTGNVNAPVYTAGAVIGVNQTWSETSVNGKQKGTAQTIDAGTVKMRSVIIRNGSLYASQNMSLPAAAPTRPASQWWQINPTTNAVIQFGRLDDPTGKYAATFPSLSVSADNDVLVGFSVFGSPIFASAGYAYRNSTDALNTLRSPTLFKTGEATYYKTYGGTRNRWGDYSATCIDPSDGSFWTLQEYAESPANTWGTWWANVGVIPFAAAVKNTDAATILNVSPNPAKNFVTVKWQSSKEGTADIHIYNEGGNILYSQKINVINGYNQHNIQIGNLQNGTYSVVVKMINGNIARGQLVVTK